MNWDAIGAFGEIIGALAVVVSVCYLAVQIKKQTDESRLESTRELARDYREVIKSVSEDKELFELYIKALSDYDGLPEEDRIRIHMFLFSRLFGVHEQHFLHRTEGRINPEFLESIRNRLSETARAPGISMWWRRNRNIYGAEFRNHIDNVLRNSADPDDEQTEKST